MLSMGVQAENNETDIGGDNRPASSGSVFTGLTGCVPDTVNESPFDQGGNDLDQKEHHDDRENGIKNIAEQIGSQPPDHADAGYGRLHFSGFTF